MAEGSSFGIVPFMKKEQLAMVSALVGAGGNAGAVFAGLVFYRQDWKNPLMPFKLHASFVLCMAILTPLFYWPEYGSMFSAPAIAESQTIRDQKSAQNDGVQFRRGDFSPKYMELDITSEVSPVEKRPSFAPQPVAHV